MITGTVTSSVHGYRTRSIPVISDAYHKKNDIRFDMCSRPLSCIAGTVSGELSSREVVNIDEEKGRPEKLLCATGTITELCGTAGQGRIVLEGSIPVKILALDSDGNPFVIESTVPLRGTLDMPALENSPDTTEIAISASIKDLWFDSIDVYKRQPVVQSNWVPILPHSSDACATKTISFSGTYPDLSIP